MHAVSQDIPSTDSPTILIGDDGVDVSVPRSTPPAELARQLDRCGAGTAVAGVQRDGNTITVKVAIAVPGDEGFCTPVGDAVWVRPGTPTAALAAALRTVPAGRGVAGAEPGPGLAVIRIAMAHTFQA